MIAIIDYGAGNIFSVKNALDYLGFENKLTDKKEDIEKADAPRRGSVPMGNEYARSQRSY